MSEIGNSNRITRAYLDQLLIETRYMDSETPDLTFRLFGETFVFSYQAEDTAARIKLLCDTYEHGEKTESAVLLDHEFVKSDNNPFVFEDRNPKYPVLKEEILSGYTRHGYLFIDCNNRATACTDEYMVES